MIGGRNETGYLSSVECYNLETNEWRYVSSLPQPLAAHAGAVHNGKIYISGKLFPRFHLMDLKIWLSPNFILKAVTNEGIFDL